MRSLLGESEVSQEEISEYSPRSEKILRNFDLLLPKFHFILPKFHFPVPWGIFVSSLEIPDFLGVGFDVGAVP